MSYDYNLFNDLVTKYTSVTLNNLGYYTTSFILDGVSIFMTVGYDSRLKQRWIILESSTGVVLLKQTYVKFGRRCELNFNSNLYNLDYYVTLKPKLAHYTPSLDYDYINWADDFDLCFVGHSYTLTERKNKNLRIALTGN